MSNPPLKTYGDMDEIFGTEPVLSEVREPRELVVVPIITKGPIGGDELKNDLAVTRETMHRILGKAEDALDDILKLARNGESARSFEVAGNLIKTVSDLSGQLIDLHKKARELEEEPDDDGPKNINVGEMNVFHGSTADMLELAIQRRKQKEKVINGDDVIEG